GHRVAVEVLAVRDRHDAVGVRGGVDEVEGDDARVVGDADARHTSRGPALRAQGGDGEAQQLRVRGHEDGVQVVQLAARRRLRSTHDGVVALEGEGVPLRAAAGRALPGDALDDAVARAQHDVAL